MRRLWDEKSNKTNIDGFLDFRIMIMRSSWTQLSKLAQLELW